MGRDGKIKNGWVWWKIQRKAGKGIQQKDEECWKYLDLTGWLQNGFHQKT